MTINGDLFIFYIYVCIYIVFSIHTICSDLPYITIIHLFGQKQLDRD